MSYRFTQTDKWTDPWFVELGSDEKLLWMFLCDNCDIGGFYEVGKKYIEFTTGIDDVSGVIEGLTRGLIINGSWVWIKKFIEHQLNLPLNDNNNAHRGIIRAILSQKERFPECLSLCDNIDLDVFRGWLGANKGLVSPTSKGKGKGKGKGLSSSSNINKSILKDKGKKEERKLSLKRNSEQFELIWSEYPRKSGKKPAGDKYKIMMPDEELFNLIYADITQRGKSYQWRKSDREFVPLLTTYLNQERWTDEMFPVDQPADESSSSGSRKPYQEEDY